MPTRDTTWPHGTPCWVDCLVDDPRAAAEFYAALFGWEIRQNAPEAGEYVFATRHGRPAAGIGPKPAGMPMPSVWNTYLASDDVDATAELIVAHGGTLFFRPFQVMDAGRMLVATDPTGAGFGVWQGAAMPGASIYNEPGAYCWNELHTDGYRRAQEFYTAVFGWAYTEIGDGENVVYSTFSLAADGPPIGGINDSSLAPPAAASYWLTWFQVDDTDAALARAAGLGATVLRAAQDSPFGRMGVLRAPQGEVFAVIDPARTADAAPEA